MLIDNGDHIYTIDNCFDENMIDSIIAEFDEAESKGVTLQRHEYTGNDHPSQKDSSLFYSATGCSNVQPLRDMVDQVSGRIIDDWLKIYPVIKSGNYHDLHVSACKVQKTYPSGGYHNWHSEHCNQWNSRNTLLAWMVYLNDVDDGGETEFLYQSKRLSPKRNQFVIWPSGFTHLHRGNPPLSGVKYVVTGWSDWI